MRACGNASMYVSVQVGRVRTRVYVHEAKRSGGASERPSVPPPWSQSRRDHDDAEDDLASTVRRFSQTSLGDCAASMGCQMPFCL